MRPTPDQLDQPTDEDLAAAISRSATTGEVLSPAVEAFEELYRRHGRLLAAYVAARTSGDETEDVLQSIWLKVWNGIADQFQGGIFRSWLYQIARNALIDQYRRRNPSLPIDEQSDEQHSDVRSEPLRHLLADERRRVLKHCFDTLAQREAEVMRSLLAGNSYAEVCSQLQINANVAYKAAKTGKSKLKTCVQQKLS